MPNSGCRFVDHATVFSVKRVSGPFTLVELAQLVGMHVEDVQFYEDCGVLPPARRRIGRAGHRAFHKEHVERLRYVKRALGCGLTIDDIQALLDPAALLTASDVYGVVQRRLSSIRQARDAHESAAHNLEKLLEKCPQTGSRRDCSILKTLASSG